MTDPLTPPPRKDPQARTPTPMLPPAARSRAALGLTAAAAEGRFMLQHCDDCGAVQYPPRDACGTCLSVALSWRDIAPEGELLAATRIHVSPDRYFRERMPWRTGAVRLDAGPSVICHLHGDCPPRGRVRLINRLDKAGQGVIMALPAEETPNMQDDPQLRALTADPRHRRVLIIDARAPDAPALCRALLQAGAAHVYLGEAEAWRPWAGRAALAAMDAVTLVPLDVTDTSSVTRLAGQIGGKVDILINNARFLRPGGVFARGDTVFAAREMEVNYFGLMRLAQAFGPAMRGRGADGTNSAVAWVNILSAYALVNAPDHASFCASQAAALSLTQALRTELRAGAVRVMGVYVGPTEDDWHQPLPPPKVTAGALARAVVAGLQDGLEEVWCGDVARDLAARWRRDAKVLEREIGDQGMGG